MKTYLVSYYADSFQFKASTMHEVSEVLFADEMPKLRKEVETTLKEAKAGSPKTFWATFSEWNGKRWEESVENFNQRIKI